MSPAALPASIEDGVWILEVINGTGAELRAGASMVGAAGAVSPEEEGLGGGGV